MENFKVFQKTCDSFSYARAYFAEVNFFLQTIAATDFIKYAHRKVSFLRY